MKRDKNPLSNAVIPVLEYLTALHLEGKSYSTINIHRSMLSTTVADNRPQERKVVGGATYGRGADD